MPFTDGLMPPGLSPAEKAIVYDFGGWSALMNAYDLNPSHPNEVFEARSFVRELALMSAASAANAAGGAPASQTSYRRAPPLQNPTSFSFAQRKVIVALVGWGRFMQLHGLRCESREDCMKGYQIAWEMAEDDKEYRALHGQ